MMHERRKFIRFNVPLDLEFRQLENTVDYYPGKTTNFSREGFCFETTDPQIRLNQILEVNIKHPLNQSVVPAQGEIVWLEQAKDKRYAGVLLTEIDKAVKSEILDYAYDIWLEDIQH